MLIIIGGSRKVSPPDKHVTLKCVKFEQFECTEERLQPKMLSTLSQKVRDVSVVRRLSFAATFLPKSMPNYWESVANFSVAHRQSRNNLTTQQVKVLVENLEEIDGGTFASDDVLIREIVDMPRCGTDIPQGIILISSKHSCSICGSNLNIRTDRPSNVIIYDDHLGTIRATHFTKYCRKLRCSYQQHYGFSTRGDSSEVTYDPDWETLPYFMSSRETAFSVSMLHRLDSEILIGQISYKQRADIYNNIHW